QRPVSGGLSVSHPFVKEAPNHYLSIGAMDDALLAYSGLVDQYKLRDYGYSAVRVDAPYGWMNEDGDTLLLHSSFDRTVKEIGYFSPKDAQTYIELRGTIDFIMNAFEKASIHHPAKLPKKELGKLLLSLAKGKDMRRIIGRMISVSAFEMISE